MISALLVAMALAAAPIELSPDARAAIAPVLDAIAAERAALASLPPAEDDAERLVRLGRLDQAGRRALSKVDFGKTPEAERSAAGKAMAEAISAVDAETLPQVLRMLPPEGWFLKSRYGEAASEAAFHIIQHANAEQWRRFVPVLEPLVAAGEVKGSQFALMYDRLAISEGRPQKYGSQFKCVGGKFVMYPLEDPARADEHRAAMGLPPLAEYAATYERMKPLC